MPLFEYKCQDCNHMFEELVFSSEAKPACPKCGSTHTSKQLSTFAAAGGSKSAGAGGGGGCGHGFK